MILIFGPTGSGKSMQGKFLAARNNWHWLSAGQLLRDENNPELLGKMEKGELIDFKVVNDVVEKALSKMDSTDNLVLDGYPRMIEQAEFLVKSQESRSQIIKFAIVLDVPRQTVLTRLLKRARADDNEQAINHRLDQYDKDMPGVFAYLEQNGTPIIHVNGDDTIGRVHDSIMRALKDRHFV